MAYRCVKNQSKECDGCMACHPEVTYTYYCPVCGDEVEETVYTTIDGEVIGCENCVQARDPEGMLDGET